MLEKSAGGVACNHCREIGADTVCRFCQRPVCTTCLASERCPVPHPYAYRLGAGWRLRAIDEESRYGYLEHLLGGGKLRHLDSGRPIGDLPGWRGELDLEYPAPPTFCGDQLLRPCATFEIVRQGDNTEKIYHDSLLLLVDVTPEGLGVPRFVERPARFGKEARRLLATDDGRRVVIVGEDGFDIVDPLAGEIIAAENLRRVIHAIALSAEDDLLCLGLFGRLAFYRLSDGELVGRLKLEDDGNATCVAAARGQVAAVTENRRVSVFAVEPKVAPRKWREVFSAKLGGRVALRPDEGDLSRDGRLLALRRRRKDVIVLDLADGSQQLLKKPHTDRIQLVRFVGGGNRLVTADKDNRVVYWPRVEHRLVTGT